MHILGLSDLPLTPAEKYHYAKWGEISGKCPPIVKPKMKDGLGGVEVDDVK